MRMVGNTPFSTLIGHWDKVMPLPHLLIIQECIYYQLFTLSLAVFIYLDTLNSSWFQIARPNSTKVQILRFEINRRGPMASIPHVPCEQCVQGFVMKEEPEGIMVGDAYLHEGKPLTTDSPDDSGAAATTNEGEATNSSGQDASKTRAVVLLTDIFGLPLVNAKLNADEMSRRLGCDVWVPDYFAGRPPFTVEELEPLAPDRAGVKTGFVNSFKMFILFLIHLPALWASRPPVADARIAEFIKKIKEEKGYTKIGAVGYCYGGSAAVRLASKGLVDSVVVCHPGPVSLKEIKAMKVPSAFVCAESDEYFAPKFRNEAEATFAARKDKPDFVEYEFVDYPGTAHGFAARPNQRLPDIVEAYKKAMGQICSWFAKTV
ncbi:hypothetical protein NLI96_g12153 [Meripilus lineatus]|uniref:Dienelactone hydrolase domain-containing protein n=1 Tax=Meripilus lineatus TaxID=2056292 RepID=A0AAD5YA50_9APHY|nr:hypothetical protein NLI96_g12153 [Physisporinus lineatus]